MNEPQYTMLKSSLKEYNTLTSAISTALIKSFLSQIACRLRIAALSQAANMLR
ncbi:MAG: hypothetical protein H0U49_09870 [Parachlamydiaceae bacterium]|nr:hypothetical protein [Parachlamydiaceae bacterium]